MTRTDSQSPFREVRASFDERVLRVYQAYTPSIARPALEAQTFRPPFKRERMTWIKPSFTWMMYRAGWGQKVDQEVILGIDITRDGFEWALAHASLAHLAAGEEATPERRAELVRAPVRVQWDPERSVRLEPLPWRAIQIGLSGAAVDAYLDAWIVRIEDVTPLAHAVRAHVEAGRLAEAERLRPRELPYPLPSAVVARIEAG